MRFEMVITDEYGDPDPNDWRPFRSKVALLNLSGNHSVSIRVAEDNSIDLDGDLNDTKDEFDGDNNYYTLIRDFGSVGASRAKHVITMLAPGKFDDIDIVDAQRWYDLSIDGLMNAISDIKIDTNLGRLDDDDV